MVDSSLYDWSKEAIPDPALHGGFLQDRSGADISEPSETTPSMVPRVHHQ